MLKTVRNKTLELSLFPDPQPKVNGFLQGLDPSSIQFLERFLCDSADKATNKPMIEAKTFTF